MLDKACAFVREVVAGGGTILFIGTKKQVQESVKDEAERCGMYYVNQRWLGGMLTNSATIQARVDQLVRLEDQQSRGEFGRLIKKEVLKIGEQIEKMNRQTGGFKEMTDLPSVWACRWWPSWIPTATRARLTTPFPPTTTPYAPSSSSAPILPMPLIKGKAGLEGAMAGAEEGKAAVVEADGEEEGVVEPFIFIQDPE
jgi:hypothetical protein